MIKSVRSYTLTLIIMTFLLAGCGKSNSEQPSTDMQSQVTAETPTPIASSNSAQIHGSGATFPLPIYLEWTYAYSEVDPTVAIDYQGIGSGAGKKAIINRTVDFAGSDSLLTPEEYQAGKDLQMYPILAGAVVVIYNIKLSKDYPSGLETPKLILDRPTLVDIYNGTVKLWNDSRIVGLNPQLSDYLPGTPITVVHRSDASGTTELFTKSLTSFSDAWTAGGANTIEWPVDKAGIGIGAEGNLGVAEAVVNTYDSLGYVELSYALSDGLVYADMINKAGRRVTANSDSLASALNDFGNEAFNNNFTATIVDGGGIGSWPIAGYTYLILHTTTMTDCDKARKLLEYIQWTLTDLSASKRAARRGYAVLTDEDRSRVLAKLREVTCEGQPVMK